MVLTVAPDGVRGFRVSSLTETMVRLLCGGAMESACTRRGFLALLGAVAALPANV